jgi:hypothetical protein
MILSVPYGKAWYDNAPRGKVGDLVGIAYRVTVPRLPREP